MTAILGLSAFYHDSAAALVVDGRIVAAAQEERFSRIKHDASFPVQAIEFCLQSANFGIAQVDYIAFYEKPLRKFERLIENYLAFVPRGYASFRQAIPQWLNEKLHVARSLRSALPSATQPVVYLEHHQSHAASAFYPSPFHEAAILTLDGVGEWATSCIGHGQGHRLRLIEQLNYPHSLGLLYSAFTGYLGFRVNSGEYKVMGLSAYGQPIYRDMILQRLVDCNADGSLRMDMRYFNYCQGLTMTSARFHKLFGGPPRLPDEPLTEQHKNIAASIQSVTEEVMFRMALHAHRLTRAKHLVMAGGVALNCVGNGHIVRDGPFDDVWIQPAAGDAGGALGAALFTWHQLLDRPRVAVTSDSQQGSSLGPAFDDLAIERELLQANVSYRRCTTTSELCEQVAAWIDQQQVVGWFQGRMEFGPRALGSRSILADARSADMQSILNSKIKVRESFRPFAPAVLDSSVHTLCSFNSAAQAEAHIPASATYMLLVAKMLDPSRLPAVTHVDGTARVQSVDAARQPLLHQLLQIFQRRTGCPAVINTSFNVRSEPIVCSPADALRCFLMTDMDALAIGNFVLHKTDQPTVLAAEKKTYLQQFDGD